MKFRTANTIRGRPIRKLGNVHVSGIKRNWNRKFSAGLSAGSSGGMTYSGNRYTANGLGKRSGKSGHASRFQHDINQDDAFLDIVEEEVLQDMDLETRQALMSMDPFKRDELITRARKTALKGFHISSLKNEAQGLYTSRFASGYRQEYALRNRAAEMVKRSSKTSRRTSEGASHAWDGPEMSGSAAEAPGSSEGSHAGSQTDMRGGSAATKSLGQGISQHVKPGGERPKGKLLSRYKRALSEQIRRSVRQEVGARLARKAAQQQYQKGEYQKAQEEAARELQGTLTGMARSGKRLGAAAMRQLGRIGKAIKGGSLVKAGFMIVPLLIIMVLMNMIMAMVSFVPSANEDEPTYGASASEIVAYALQWVGVTKYIYGAGREYETDWQDYADCSSFVHGVFSHFGIETGGDTCSMEDDGTIVANVSLDEALPGDIILFFSGGITPGNSYHVGLYIGEGEMVHCTGGRSCVSPETAGPGVLVRDVYGSSYQVRRIVTESFGGGIGTGGHRVDPTHYSQAELETIWAVVAQEDNGSYEGALAVISCAMNRTESPTWSYLGSTAMQQLTAPGQFCYSMDSYWIPRLGGNVPAYVKQAVTDCLQKGIRNHSFTSFRSTKGKTTGDDAVQIGGNWFFGH